MEPWLVEPAYRPRTHRSRPGEESRAETPSAPPLRQLRKVHSSGLYCPRSIEVAGVSRLDSQQSNLIGPQPWKRRPESDCFGLAMRTRIDPRLYPKRSAQ